MMNTEIDYLLSDISSYLYYYGTYDPGKKYGPGDVVLIDGNICVQVGQSWEPICLANEEKEEVKEEAKEPILTRLMCFSCGAPLKIKPKGGFKCEYCGMEYKEE